MLDPFVLVAPVFLLAVVGLLAFVGCLSKPPFAPGVVEFAGVRVDFVQTTPTTFVQANFAGAVTEGHLLVVWIWYRTSTGQTVASVTDSAGNSYLAADALAAGAGALAAIRQQVWYAADAKAGSGSAPITITATFSGAVEPNAGLGVFEYAHVDPTEPVVVTAQARGFGAEARTGAVNTMGARLLFGAVVFSGGGVNDPMAILRLLQEGNVAEDYLVPPIPNEIVCTTTPPGSQEDWIAQLVAFS